MSLPDRFRMRGARSSSALRANTLPSYRSMNSPTPPSYSSRSDIASEQQQNAIPEPSPTQAALNIANSSVGDPPSSVAPVYCTPSRLWSLSARSNTRTVYYRLFDEESAIPSKRWFDAADLSIGRANATWIPPPWTVLAIKCFVCKEEGLDGGVALRMQYYTDNASQPVDDAQSMALLGGPGQHGSAITNALRMKILNKSKNAFFVMFELAMIAMPYITPYLEAS
ncbi:hypothetical protein HWV62_32043 [Athelia sp. TMB]|nr:hypothetical protein HWV62_32043 [Athelia sp. TMB]